MAEQPDKASPATPEPKADADPKKEHPADCATQLAALLRSLPTKPTKEKLK